VYCEREPVEINEGFYIPSVREYSKRSSHEQFQTECTQVGPGTLTQIIVYFSNHISNSNSFKGMNKLQYKGKRNSFVNYRNFF
jgi:hypothetical protein